MKHSEVILVAKHSSIMRLLVVKYSTTVIVVVGGLLDFVIYAFKAAVFSGTTVMFSNKNISS